MTEENEKSESKRRKDGEAESGRAVARRTQREARRSTGRSTSLKRKSPETKQAAADSPPVEKEKSPTRAKAKPRAKTRSRQPTAKKQPKTSTTAKTSTYSSATAKKKRAKPTKSTRYSSAKKRAPDKEEEGFEIRSQPDGTSRRVKISKTGKKRDPRRVQEFMDQSGPGPAIVDLSTVSPGIWTRKRDIDLGYAAAETQDSVNYLKRYISVTPKVVVVLGSGLSGIGEMVEGETIQFSDIPGFNPTRVLGHTGQIRAGLLGYAPVMFLEGRRHLYETGSMKETVHPILTALALGARHVILTTAAGAVNTSYRPGDVMFVKDHINLMGDNPLFGKDPGGKPSVFVDCGEIYDQSVIGNAGKICRAAGVKKRVGILAGVRGPVYETPTEKAWLKYMGVDAVCMSVIPEALAAAHLGVKVTALALITNQASPRKKEPVRHEDVVSSAQSNAEAMQKIISLIIDQLP